MIDPREIHRLETILVVIESSFSDHGLSLYRSSGLLDKFKGGTECACLSLSLFCIYKIPLMSPKGMHRDPFEYCTELTTGESVDGDHWGFEESC